MRKRLINACIVVMIVLCIYGCARTAGDTLAAETETEETSHTEIEGEEEPNAEDVTPKSEETAISEENPEEATADESVDDRSIDLTDYSSYLRKVWCMNGEDSDEEMPNREVPVSLVRDLARIK